MITAQDLYDWREATAAISGTDLHRLFQDILGDPSPAGRRPIGLADIAELARDGDEDAMVALLGVIAYRSERFRS